VTDATQDPTEIARAIIDSNLYMTLGTADRGGTPWATPVYYAHEDYTQFFWVSQRDARHSANIADRPEVGIVIFDSTIPINTGQAVYMAARASELGADGLDPGLDLFSRRGQGHGGSHWVPQDVLPPARHRFYRAIASEQFVLDEHDERVPVRW
jgi:uncharacterized protein YhbP (UPF0306 family)